MLYFMVSDIQCIGYIFIVDRVGGSGEKKVKRSAKEYICIAHGHRQQCGEGQGRGGECWVEKGKVGKIGMSILGLTEKKM